jgi:DNA polymerase-3 subunit gamma/tau
MNESIITKYRPKQFSEVWGHENACRALERVLASPNRPHTYLITGPSGIGKTTLARLISLTLDAAIEEPDAATHSGVDDMRTVVEDSAFFALGGSGNKVYIINECHALSHNAWRALLKLAEEPPDHFYLVLCTTEPGKVPAPFTNQRAYHIPLNPLPFNLIEEYIYKIAEIEQWTLNHDVANAIATAADGAPRRALMVLLRCHDAVHPREVGSVAATLDDDTNPLIRLCQVLSRGKPSWDAIKPLLASIEDTQYDTALSTMGRYFIGVIMRSTDFRATSHIAEYLAAITFPTETYDKKVQFFAAMMRIILPS